MKESLTIWDQNSYPLKSPADQIVLWRIYNLKGNLDLISIPELVEKKANKYRSLFLSWVYEVGQTKVDGITLIDHFKGRHKFSYWWMTLFVEKCNYFKTPLITDVIKIFALEDLIEGRSLSKIKLVSSNKYLINALRDWSVNKNINFEYNYIYKKKKTSTIRRLYYVIPILLRGILWFVKFITERWRLRSFGLENWIKTDGKILFVTYLYNIKKKSENNYEDPYWTKLPIFLNKKNIKTNWLHFLIKDGVPFNIKEVQKFILRKNRKSNKMESHVTIFSFLSFSVINNTIKDWFFLYKKNLKLETSFSKLIDKKYLWHFFSKDWKDSIYGQVAFSNLLTLNLFESALNYLPKQTSGLYPQENQGWEFGFLNAWKEAKHGNLIGHPHSTVKFWDLRYFHDSRTYNGSINNEEFPRANKIACNGPVAMSAYKDHGYPKKDLVDVEALRYLHIKNQPKKKFHNSKKIRLLVFGDYLETNTIKQLKMLQRALLKLNERFSVFFKAHPACPNINLSLYVDIKKENSNEKVENLIPKFDVIFASSSTSAAVDAYCSGLITITLLDGEQLNLSPLRNFEGAMFVEDHLQLSNCLEKTINQYQDTTNKKTYFNLNSDLPLWNKLLINRHNVKFKY